VLERPDIAHDPILSQRANRLKKREHLFSIMQEVFVTQPWSYWQSRLRAAAVPHGQVRTLGEALASDEARSRSLVYRIPHPVKGWIPNIASPLRLARTPFIEPKAAPAVGANTTEILRDVLHFDEARIKALRDSGALDQ